ncbi:MAG: radical SAM protein [Deferribacteraceae bacterium]|jgi:wyosine [tRNA(Phe)-imidazoG37] synthetase (radical SAM superfamily)|nr:radical SAM protein [Deferribacteraceae bacterium]
MYIFGPIMSRRFGRSLGVNVIPEKICSFDCIYCEVGRTKTTTMARRPYAPADKILAEFNERYPSVERRMDVITVTGYGEPTLNTEFEKVLDGIKESAHHPVVILTNSSTMHIPQVFETLKKFDVVVPSIDAVRVGKFKQVDNPHPSVDINQIKRALVDFSKDYRGKLLIELLLVKGVNDEEEDLAAFAEYIGEVNYSQVQLTTVFRPPSHQDVARLTDEELAEKYLILSSYGVERIIIPGDICSTADNYSLELSEDDICAALKMRPMSVAALAEGLSIDPILAEVMVEDLLTRGLLNSAEYDNEVYYSLRRGGA